MYHCWSRMVFMANSYTEGQRKNVIVLGFIYDFGEESSWFLCPTLKNNSGLWLATGELKWGETEELGRARAGQGETSHLGWGLGIILCALLFSLQNLDTGKLVQSCFYHLEASFLYGSPIWTNISPY